MRKINNKWILEKADKAYITMSIIVTVILVALLIVALSSGGA